VDQQLICLVLVEKQIDSVGQDHMPIAIVHDLHQGNVINADVMKVVPNAALHKAKIQLPVSLLEMEW
jgi:hypothetical protein